MIQLDYDFKNKTLLDLALTQSGVNAKQNNERLEFIGDRVLGLAVAIMLYEMFPEEVEGQLARRHAKLVSTETLATVANRMGLWREIQHGHMTAGRTKHMVADAMEAVFGAIYLDGGFSAAQNVIVKIWRNLAALEINAPKDPKTALQEYVQKNAPVGVLPVYEYLPPIGAAHEPTFVVNVSALGKTATGQGSSKKIASTVAAAALLKLLAI